MQGNNIEAIIAELYHDSRHDKIKMLKGVAKSMFRSMQPTDFEEVYLSISSKQGEDLKHLILKNKLKNIVEFGTSFGISTLFLAQGIKETGGKIITTELLESKAKKAIGNFKKAGVNNLIEVRIGDAMSTLVNHNEPIDLLLLDGWKNLYLPLFQLLKPNFHDNTFIYVDNADMADTKVFLKTISKIDKYHLEYMFGDKVVLISLNSKTK